MTISNNSVQVTHKAPMSEMNRVSADYSTIERELSNNKTPSLSINRPGRKTNKRKKSLGTNVA